MPRIALLLEYLGKEFCGSQSQANARTVQSELEQAISTLLRRQTKVTLSGRTDSGVHAAGQVAHFDLVETDLEIELAGDLWRLTWALNGILPGDLSVVCGQIVPDDFHARHSATARQYVYRILNRPQRSPVLQDTYYFYPYALDYKKMTEAAGFLLGRHDFGSFRSTNSDRSTNICTVMTAKLLNLGEGRLEFWIAADHFVYNMVRIIVGTLIEIGSGERAPESLASALQRSDRNLAGPTAPAWGLTLASVKYLESLGLFENKNTREITEATLADI